MYLLVSPTRALNKKTELTPRVITRFDRYPRESKQTELTLRATNLFKRPPMILGGSSGDSRARTMHVF